MDYAFYRGDSLVIDLTITQTNGGVTAPVDLTGATLWMTAKKRSTDADAQAVFQVKTPDDIKIDNDPLIGKARIVVPGSATTALRYEPNVARIELLYDVQVKTETGIVQTVALGKLFVDQDITQNEA